MYARIYVYCFYCIEEARLRAEREEQERLIREMKQREIERLDLKVSRPRGILLF